jgi:tRNA modification GTPase
MGKAAVAILRVSGPQAEAAMRMLVGDLPPARTAAVRSIRDPKTREIIDRGLVLWFPAPASFTGEDSTELQVHGSRSVIAAILRLLGALPGLRQAEPGEFARRALAHDKLDLIGVEALGDLIDAETEAQRRLAMDQASGRLKGQVDDWRSQLIDALVLIESELDFSDESDAPFAVRPQVHRVCEELLASIGSCLDQSHRAELVREGMTVLIAGPPNAGKSTLLNALAQRDVAIVSEWAGTTRDLIEVRLDLAGFPVNLIDTAGIHASDNPVEREGIQRALKRGETADLVLWLTPLDGPRLDPPDGLSRRPTRVATRGLRTLLQGLAIQCLWFRRRQAKIATCCSKSWNAMRRMSCRSKGRRSPQPNGSAHLWWRREMRFSTR